MALVVSEKTLATIKMSGEDLLIDLACHLYEKRKLSFGKARSLAGIAYRDFQQELVKRDIPLNYSEDDLATDLKNIQALL
ncbi:MAG: UPF0175 family protein [Bacteroidota bacterium]